MTLEVDLVGVGIPEGAGLEDGALGLVVLRHSPHSLLKKSIASSSRWVNSLRGIFAKTNGWNPEIARPSLAGARQQTAAGTRYARSRKIDYGCVKSIMGGRRASRRRSG
jgi:hypothetical protein